ncbi:hypothetical protein IAU60_001846 [Kwoniella sp. DSM 27419]
MQPTPSVLAHHYQPQNMNPPFDGYGSAYPMPLGEGPSSPGRRQRISMACQYCRHRKIRCCGGSPCRNCTRAKRECEYAPVPEEVNRATREKKAIAKATKSTHYASPVTTSSPYFIDQPVYNVSYVSGPGPIRPAHLGHRRTVSMPSNAVAPWAVPPPAPALASPAMFESPQWMYSNWNGQPAPSSQPSVRAFPSVLEQTPVHQAYLQSQSTPEATSRSSSADSEMAGAPLPTYWSTSSVPTQTYLRPAQPVTPQSGIKYPMSSPITPGYHTPYPTPPMFQVPFASQQHPQGMHQQPYYSTSPLAQSTSNSPTLAPEMPLPPQKDHLVGLGFSMPDPTEYYQTPTPTLSNDEYFAAPMQF